MMKRRMNKKATLALLATLTTACCAFGATLVTNASADTVQPTTGFYMVEGAQIRLTSGTTGIRFRAQLSAAEYEEDKTYGVIIMPTQYLNGITGDYIASLDTKYGFTEKDGEQVPNGYVQMESIPLANGNDYYVQGSIANIKYDNINLAFTGIAYEYDGENYQYAEIVGGDYSVVSRSVVRVATAAYNEYKYEGNPENYDEETQVSVMKEFIQMSKNKALGNAADAMTEIADSVAFEADSVEVVLGAEKTLAITANIPTNNAVWESSDKSVATVENGVVKGLKLGTTTITVKNGDATATCTVKVNVDTTDITGNYLATFSSANYANLVVNDNEGGVNQDLLKCSNLTTEYVENVADINGLKVANALKITAQVGAHTYSEFKIYLPKAISASNYTVKFMVDSESTEGWWARTLKSDGSTSVEFSGAVDTWRTVVSTGDSKSSDYLYVRLGTTPRATVVFYIDCVMNGDQSAYIKAEENEQILAGLTNSLGENYLADFSSSAYSMLVTNHADATFACKSLTTEYVETVVDKNGAVGKGVLKITATENPYLPYSQFYIRLPKAISSSQFTIRCMVDESTSDGWWIRPLASSEALYGETYSIKLHGNDRAKNEWITQESLSYAPSESNEYIHVRFGVDNVAASETKTVVIYIDCVMNGNQTSALKAQETADAIEYLKANLEEGYLADFSTGAYANLFSWTGETFYPRNFKAELVKNVTDSQGNTAENALKITLDLPLVNTYVGCWFNFNLPKAMTNATHQMRIMVQGENIPEGWWIRTVNASGGGDLHLGNPGDATTDVWCTQNITNVFGDYVRFFFGVNGTTTQTITFYLDFIK